MTGGLRFFFIFAMTMSVTSCFQTFNSSTTDPSRYGSDLTGDGSPASQRFLAAYSLMKNRCFACHAHGFNALTTEQQFIDTNNYVVAGSPQTSNLYLALRGTGLPNGPQDMPQDGALNATELATIRDWITQIGQ